MNSIGLSFIKTYHNITEHLESKFMLVSLRIVIENSSLDTNGSNKVNAEDERRTCFGGMKNTFHTLGTVYPKKYAYVFCFAVLCCGYTLTDFPISIRLTSLALWQSNDCPSASKTTLMNLDKYFMWIHYERLYNHNKAKPNKTVCIFLGIYCSSLHPVTEEVASLNVSQAH